MNTNMNKTEILDKVVLFSGLLLLDNSYFERSRRLLEVWLTQVDKCSDYVSLFQGSAFYICPV